VAGGRCCRFAPPLRGSLRLAVSLRSALWPGRGTEKHFETERLDTPPHEEMLLATLAQCQRTPSRPRPTGHPAIAKKSSPQQSWGLAHGAKPRDAGSPQQPRAQEIWADHTIRPREINHATLPTAGCGKPHVRWCGSPDGRKSRQGDPILAACAVAMLARAWRSSATSTAPRSSERSGAQVGQAVPARRGIR
jgi:hypothetical protein